MTDNEPNADERVTAALINAMNKRDFLKLDLADAEREVARLNALRDQVSAQTDMQWAERLAKDGLGPTAWERACAWARGEVDAYPERAR